MEQEQGQSAAFFDSYDGVEIELPGGKKVRGRALGLREAAKYLRLMHRIRSTGETEAILAVLDPDSADYFPRAVGLEEELEFLQPVELLEVVERFLAARRTSPQQ